MKGLRFVLDGGHKKKSSHSRNLFWLGLGVKQNNRFFDVSFLPNFIELNFNEKVREIMKFRFIIFFLNGLIKQKNV